MLLEVPSAFLDFKVSALEILPTVKSSEHFLDLSRFSSALEVYQISGAVWLCENEAWPSCRQEVETGDSSGRKPLASLSLTVTSLDDERIPAVDRAGFVPPLFQAEVRLKFGVGSGWTNLRQSSLPCCALMPLSISSCT